MSNNITTDQVVAINYTLTDDLGQEIDTSRGREPLEYLHGHGQLVPGVERALEGKQQGSLVKVSVPPEDGYGLADPAKRFSVPREQIGFDIAAGDVVQAELQNGQRVPFQVVAVGLAEVTLDGNHPLAGKTLNFDIEVVSVRAATDEELAHGHAHGGNSHH